MTDMAIDLNLLRENIQSIQKAITLNAGNGGLIQYTYSTGQGSTSVRQASLGELVDLLKQLNSLYNDLQGQINGSNISILRGVNAGFYNQRIF